MTANSTARLTTSSLPAFLRFAIIALSVCAVALAVTIRATSPHNSPLSAGEPAPPFSLRAELGGQIQPGYVTLSEQRGHPVLLLFTYSLCSHCLQESDAVARLSAELAPRGLRTLYIDSPAETPGIIAAYAQRLDITTPILLDDGGAVAARYGVMTYPGAILVSATGNLLAVWHGETSASVIRPSVERALATTAP